MVLVHGRQSQNDRISDTFFSGLNLIARGFLHLDAGSAPSVEAVTADLRSLIGSVQSKSCLLFFANRHSSRSICCWLKPTEFIDRNQIERMSPISSGSDFFLLASHFPDGNGRCFSSWEKHRESKGIHTGIQLIPMYSRGTQQLPHALKRTTPNVTLTVLTLSLLLESNLWVKRQIPCRLWAWLVQPELVRCYLAKQPAGQDFNQSLDGVDGAK